MAYFLMMLKVYPRLQKRLPHFPLLLHLWLLQSYLLFVASPLASPASPLPIIPVALWAPSTGTPLPFPWRPLRPRRRRAIIHFPLSFPSVPFTRSWSNFTLHFSCCYLLMNLAVCCSCSPSLPLAIGSLQIPGWIALLTDISKSSNFIRCSVR